MFIDLVAVLGIEKQVEVPREKQTPISFWSAPYPSALLVGIPPYRSASWGSRAIGKDLGFWAVIARLPER